MNKLINILLLVVMVLAGQQSLASKPALVFNKLTCEYVKNPMGLEVTHPRFSWTLTSDLRNQVQTAYEIIVSEEARITVHSNATVWSSGKISSDESIQIIYSGKPLQSFKRYFWQVRVYDQNGVASTWSRPQWFEMAALNQTDWKGKWIGDGSRQFTKDEDFYGDDPMPLFRKTFETSKKTISARLYISGLGYYEAYLNGNKIGDHMLDPGWTSYQKEVLYVVHDVTGLLKTGKNVAGIMLGNGWYNPLPLKFWGGLNMRNALVTDRPKVRAMLRLTYADGSTENIFTDENWKTAPGPVIRNNVYLGEQFDARAEIANWSTGKENDHSWKNAVVVAAPEGVLAIQKQPPVKVTSTINPVSLKEIKPGVYIYDMGQNFAGVAQLNVKGPAGTKVKIRYGEDIYADGTLNPMTSVAGQIKGGNGGPGAPAIAWQEDTYTLRGKGSEVWSPRFTFHGFRYVEVTGWPGKPVLNSIKGLRLSADLEQSGEFSSSNEMFNKLDRNIQYTFLSNVFSVQSDCPAREKLGYGGDLFCTTESFMYHYDMSNFYSKIVKDFANEQTPQGGITETVPFVGIADAGPGDKSGPLGFQVGYPYLIRKIYDFYGDKRIIEENYASLTKHIMFLKSKAKNNLLDTDLGDHESLDERAIPFTASVFYFLHARLMSDFAEICGKHNEQEEYAQLSEKIKLAIQNKFDLTGDGKFEKGTQSAQVFALWAKIERTDSRDKVFEIFKKEIENKKSHLSTGIFGTKMLFDVLREEGRNDIAYTIANQRDFPGWGYMIANGATTLWETWAASDNTFSKNHPMFGSVGEWFYRSLLGINGTSAGFKKFIIKPQPEGDLTWCRGNYHTMYGKISSSWRISEGSFTLDVGVPVNTNSEIWIPLKYGKHITESGKPVEEIPTLKMIRKTNDYIVYSTGSGNYSFKCF